MADAVADSPSSAAIKLTDLPVEILHNIKANLHSLQSHVYFSRTCKATNALYNETTFRNILFAAGWSLSGVFVEDDLDDGEPIWEIMADLIVEDAEHFKEHSEINAWATAEVIFEEHLKSDCIANIKTQAAIIKEDLCIDVKREPWLPFHSEKPEEEVFAVPKREDDFGEGLPLFEHPYVWARLFTTPAISEAIVDNGKGSGKFRVKNEHGLTIMDCLSPIAETLTGLGEDYWDYTATFFEGLHTYNGTHFTVSWRS